jgi:hypothetical protein
MIGGTFGGEFVRDMFSSASFAYRLPDNILNISQNIGRHVNSWKTRQYRKCNINHSDKLINSGSYEKITFSRVSQR